MKKVCLLIASFICLTACSHTYFVVRHAEKADPGAQMSSDVPLSEAGKARAIALRDRLKSESIKSIYSTNTIRTRSTAEPLSTLIDVPLQLYGPMPDSAFYTRIKMSGNNMLIVGHSNTVDDIVNNLTGEKSISGDLEDSVYDRLFIIRKQTFPGKKAKFREEKL